MKPGNPYLAYYGEETQFRSDDKRTVESGRKGGLASGRKRRLQAERRKHLTRAVADLVYCEYLADVTAEELRDFIRWRGHKKRKQTLLAKAVLDDSEEAEEDYCQLMGFLEEWRYIMVKSRPTKRFWESLYYVDFYQATALARTCVERDAVFSDIINDLMKCLEQIYV